MDNLSKDDRTKNMKNIRHKNTIPEKIVFDELKRRKIYFAKHVKKIKGNPDIVFRNGKVIVFIDSDFWHGNPKKYIKPKTNTKYWENKIARNIKRDSEVTIELKKQGWIVLRFWESNIKSKEKEIIDIIVTILKMRRQSTCT